jgi:hypothetical protein
MKTIKQVEITPIFCEDKLPQNPFKDYAKNTVYINKDRTMIAFNCLCGCGDFINLPLSEHGWQLQVDNQQRITLIGSVLQWNCKSHYIITNNKANFV